ncbi:MAG: MMPL family transporter [Natrialbaceae archaeon]|nr:MMPL family transporter [Natrialbaceae archaeon]
MLRAQHRLQETEGLRVSSTASVAQIVASTLDPTAQSLPDQIDAVEGATPSEIDQAVRRANSGSDRFAGLLSNDFNPQEGTARATIGTVQHQVPAGLSSGAGMGGSSPLTAIQLRADRVVDTVGGDFMVFGSGLFAAEFSAVIQDSMLIVVPAAVLFIIIFLVVAYRDLVDLLLGVIALAITIIWTFGFMGLVGIPFSQMLITVPPLLLAVGIDFGIHAINRYREEREAGADINTGMRLTTDQLLVAFFIVTGTTIIGFLANLSSDLPPIQDFGLVAAIGILFTLLIFGIFLPATKVYIDRLRERYPIPVISQRPLGSEGSMLGQLLSGGVHIARLAPAVFLVIVLIGTVSAGVYATDIGTDFSQEDFLPPADTPDYLQQLPEPFAPDDYQVVATLNFLEDHFSAAQQSQVTVYVEGPLTRNMALESIHQAGADPPSSILRDGQYAQSQSIIDVIDSRTAQDPAFAQLVQKNDRNGNGIPDDNLRTIYDRLFESDAAGSASSYITEDYRSARVVYSVDAEATQDEIVAGGQAVADDYRFEAIATGQTIVFASISDVIFMSAVTSLSIALIGTALFLLIVYAVLEGRASLGIANLVPIIVTVTAIAACMRYLGISFNAFTATILAITVGLGVDYSVHVTHRFIDEYWKRETLDEALIRTVRGTGGALTGSMLTTVFGIGVLVLAVFPVIGQFGILTALSIIFSYLSSLLVLPSVLVLWAKYDQTVHPAATDIEDESGLPTP